MYHIAKNRNGDVNVFYNFGLVFKGIDRLISNGHNRAIAFKGELSQK